jgi:hypothetical protein
MPSHILLEQISYDCEKVIFHTHTKSAVLEIRRKKIVYLSEGLTMQL